MINNNPTAFSHVPDVGFSKNNLLLENEAVQRGKVLVVDDEIDIVSTLQTYLSGKGYKTLGCTSVKGAIDALKKYDFDLLLIDLMMPAMNGIEVLKLALDIDPHLIGIIITGHGTIQSAIDAMKAGAFDFLLKPFKFDLMSPILARAMKVRELSKAEDKCRSLADELSYRVMEFQKVSDKDFDNEHKILELREEAEALKEALSKYKDTKSNMFFNGSAGY